MKINVQWLISSQHWIIPWKSQGQKCIKCMKHRCFVGKCRFLPTKETSTTGAYLLQIAHSGQLSLPTSSAPFSTVHVISSYSFRHLILMSSEIVHFLNCTTAAPTPSTTYTMYSLHCRHVRGCSVTQQHQTVWTGYLKSPRWTRWG